MARNVHTMDGIPPETTGPRGPRLSPAQVRVLQICRQGSFLLRCSDAIGAVPEKFWAAGAWVASTKGRGTGMVLIAGGTVTSLVERELLSLDERSDDVVIAWATDAGFAALEAGNIG